MEKEIYLVIALDEGYYNGVVGVFEELKEAVQFVDKQGYILATEDEFPYYGLLDYVEEDGAKYRMIIEREVVFIA